MDDWDILWGNMKGRVAHPLRLIAFDVGDTPRHCIGYLEDDTLLFGGSGKVCELAVATRFGQPCRKEQPRRVASCRHITIVLNSSSGVLKRNKKPILTKYKSDMGYNIPSNSVPKKKV